MRHIVLFLAFFVFDVAAYGQSNSLHCYIDAAKRNSPLLNDYRNRMQIEQDELQRLKAMYRHSLLEVNGDYLFVPIVSKDGGRTSFQWNARDATDYYGYDLGESSGFLHAGVTWTQPLLGNQSYRVAQEQSRITTEIARNHLRMEEHRLERAVTEQYLLCLLDKKQTAFADSVGAVLARQEEIVGRLVENGLPKSAVQCDETLTEHWIMRLADDSTAIKVLVNIGNSTTDSIEILSPTLSLQDRIIQTGGYGLEDKARVTVIQ